MTRAQLQNIQQQVKRTEQLQQSIDGIESLIRGFAARQSKHKSKQYSLWLSRARGFASEPHDSGIHVLIGAVVVATAIIPALKVRLKELRAELAALPAVVTATDEPKTKGDSTK